MNAEHRTGGGPWQEVAADLLRLSVTRVYGLPDDSMEAATALQNGGLEVVVTREQRTAVYAAAGQAMSGEGPGVAVVGRGPGTAACIPALVEARSQGAPIILLAQSHSAAAVPELSFQWLNQRALLEPACKSVLEWHPGIVQEAVAVAVEAPPGPVAILIPEEDEKAVMSADALGSGGSPRPRDNAADTFHQQFSRPVVVLGGGCRQHRERVRELIELWDAPVLVTASGRGLIDENHEHFLGVAGLYSHSSVRSLYSKADIMIALGTELEETALEFVPESLPILQVALERSTEVWPGRTVVRRKVEVGDWKPDVEILHCPSWKDDWVQARKMTLSWAEEIHASERVAGIIGRIGELITPGSAVTFENGATDIWAYLWPILSLPDDTTVLALSEQTTLGASVPAAAALARTRAFNTVFAFAGDGAFVRCLHEPWILSQPGVVYVVFDDGGHGWLAQQAASFDLAPEDYASGAPSWWSGNRDQPLKIIQIRGPEDIDRIAPYIASSVGTMPLVLSVPVAPHERSPVALGTW